MNKDDKFRFNYSAPTASERKQVESIRSIYAPEKTSSDRERLVRLNNKAHAIPMAVSLSVGVTGLLIFGLGMTFALNWENLVAGIILGVAGAAVMAIAYPVHRLIFKKLKAKYSSEIIALCDSILNEEVDK